MCFGCQLDEPCGFSGDHWQMQKMFQCDYGYLQRVFFFPGIVPLLHSVGNKTYYYYYHRNGNPHTWKDDLFFLNGALNPNYEMIFLLMCMLRPNLVIQRSRFNTFSRHTAVTLSRTITVIHWFLLTNYVANSPTLRILWIRLYEIK